MKGREKDENITVSSSKSQERYIFTVGIPLFGFSRAKRINSNPNTLAHDNVSPPRIVYRHSSTINHSVNEVLAITLGNVSNEGHPAISGTWRAKALRNRK